MTSALAPGRRRGISLSVKLILTTSVLVAGAVFASGWFATRAIEDLARGDAEQRRERGAAAIAREAELSSLNVAATVTFPVATNALGDVQPLVDEAVHDHPRIQALVVADQTGQIIAATDPARTGTPLDDALVAKVAAAAPGTVVRVGEGTEWTYGAAVRMGQSRTLVGQVRVVVSTADLEQELAASIRAAGARARAERDRLIVVALVLLGAGVALAALQALRMARPLRLLADQAQRIAGGDLDRRVPEDRRDEIGVLARNFNFMAGRIGELLVEKAAAASLAHEMNLAREVQQAMLPPPALVVHGDTRVLGHCVPASSCGGDWWTYRGLSGGRMLIVLGDATGHGVHSAMIAATARGAVEALADTGEELLTPAQVLRAIDSAISGVGDHALLMTAFCAVLDPAAGRIDFANAGQNFPYLMHRDAAGGIAGAQIIAASGNPLGDPAIAHQVGVGTARLAVGDTLIAFSDGVVERANPDGKMFGDRRLRDALQGRPADSPAALVALRQHLVETVDRFAAGTDADDDVTFVLVQFAPASEQER
ncbi:MAG: SpoIIE family protein phosphatase, partial [Myxococcales bacterium]|nr:SpoIIE family protein phosphatase [Myxococcales bacterium]